MLHNAAESLSECAPSTLQAAYFEQLRAVIETAGVEQVTAESGLAAERIDTLAAGDEPTLTVEEAAAVLAVDDGNPDAEAIVFELRDHLLLGMTTAVLDVDTVAANAETDLTGQEIQQAIEGRTEMTLAQLAAIQAVIDGQEN